MEHQEITKKTLRQFGLMVGGIFLFIGLWPWVWRHEAVRLWAVVPGTLLIAAGAVIPSLLREIYKGWMFLGHILGWINTRIILGVLFYGIVTPMGVVMRLAGRDPMRRTFDPDAQTYRVIRQARPASHMKNMF
jgi:polyferredoxin